MLIRDIVTITLRLRLILFRLQRLCIFSLNTVGFWFVMKTPKLITDNSLMYKCITLLIQACAMWTISTLMLNIWGNCNTLMVLWKYLQPSSKLPLANLLTDDQKKKKNWTKNIFCNPVKLILTVLPTSLQRNCSSRILSSRANKQSFVYLEIFRRLREEVLWRSVTQLLYLSSSRIHDIIKEMKLNQRITEEAYSKYFRQWKEME